MKAFLKVCCKLSFKQETCPLISSYTIFMKRLVGKILRQKVGIKIKVIPKYAFFKRGKIENYCWHTKYLE